MIRPALALLAALFALVAEAAQPGVPHPHQGKLKPFVPGPPALVLTAADQAKLDAGDMITLQTKDASGIGGRATAVQAVHAPPKFIWKQLLDLDAYPGKVDKLSVCKTYFEQKEGLDGSKRVKARFVVKAAPGFGFEYFCDHRYSAPKKSLTWTLDYDRDNDFDDVCGHWYVTAHPTRPEWSTVFYSADLALKTYVPGFIMNILQGTALKSAVSWVKKYSEADWATNGHLDQGRRKLALPSFHGAAGLGGKGGQGGWFGFGAPAPPPLPPPPPPPPVPFYRQPRVLVSAGVVGGFGAGYAVGASTRAQPAGMAQ